MTVEEARHRLQVLAIDTTLAGDREIRRLTLSENEAIAAILAELHRLNIAVSSQRKTLEKTAAAKNKTRQKPAQPRSGPAMARSTAPKGEKRK